MTKNARWEQTIGQHLRERGDGELQALLVPKLAMACFQSAYERWVRDPARTSPPWWTRASPPWPTCSHPAAHGRSEASMKAI
jgi:hypothetical protein